MIYTPEPWPDEDYVGGYLDSTFDHHVRCFLPFFGENHADSQLQLWSPILHRGGQELTAETSVRQLRPFMTTHEFHDFDMPFARCSHPRYVALLLELLRDSMTYTGVVSYAIWDGGVGHVPAALQGIGVNDPRRIFIRAGYLKHYRDTLEWLEHSITEPRCWELPVFTWPDDASFFMSCPVYSDSIFFSGTAAFISQVKATLPDTIDIQPTDKLAPIYLD